MTTAATKSERLPSPWHALTHRETCPVCGQRGACLVSGDPASAAVCKSVRSAASVGGSAWLHEPQRGPAWPKWQASLPLLRRRLAEL